MDLQFCTNVILNHNLTYEDGLSITYLQLLTRAKGIGVSMIGGEAVRQLCGFRWGIMHCSGLMVEERWRPGGSEK